MKKLLILCACIFVGCTDAPMTHEKELIPTATIGAQTFTLELADTEVKRQIGLMWREALPENHGMLFLFQNSARHAFWMKNTLIPLDLIWISAEKEVIDVQTLEPCPAGEMNCPSFAPKEPAQYVLEVAAGTFTGKIGERAVFRLASKKNSFD